MPITDRFAKQMHDYVDAADNFGSENIETMVAYFQKHNILSTVSATSTNLVLNQVKLKDFFIPSNKHFSRYKRAVEFKIPIEEYLLNDKKFTIGNGMLYCNSGLLWLLTIATVLFLSRIIKHA